MAPGDLDRGRSGANMSKDAHRKRVFIYDLLVLHEVCRLQLKAILAYFILRSDQ